jgi:hypothetical protein
VKDALSVSLDPYRGALHTIKGFEVPGLKPATSNCVIRLRSTQGVHRVFHLKVYIYHTSDLPAAVERGSLVAVVARGSERCPTLLCTSPLPTYLRYCRKSSTYGLDIRNMSTAVGNNKSTASSAWRHEKLIEILDPVSWPS